jgi:peptidyl-prolyl cis-trans isomerase B (cyclophilin B)
MRSHALRRHAAACWLVVLLLAAAVASGGWGCRKAEKKPAETASGEVRAQELEAEQPAGEEPGPATVEEKPESASEKAERPEPQALIETDRGDILIRLFINETPKTVENFVELATEGYFDDITWHRVVPGFVAQTGDPTGTGGGGKTYDGEPLPDEIDAVALGLDKTLVRDADPATRGRLQQELGPRFAEVQDTSLMDVYTKAFGYKYARGLGKHRFVAGSVGMANAGAGTGTSQFFIVLENPQPHLDGRHTLFGEVTHGLDVAQKLKQGDKLIRITIIEE